MQNKASYAGFFQIQITPRFRTNRTNSKPNKKKHEQYMDRKRERERERGVYIEIDRLGGRNWNRGRIEAREFTRVLSCWDSSYFWGRWICRTDMYIYVCMCVCMCEKKDERETRRRLRAVVSPSLPSQRHTTVSPWEKKKGEKLLLLRARLTAWLTVERCYIHVRPTSQSKHVLLPIRFWLPIKRLLKLVMLNFIFVIFCS